MSHKITAQARARFLEELARVPNVARAARIVGHHPQTFQKHRREDAVFAEEWEHAVEEAIERCELAVHDRAFLGVDKPIVHQGEFTYLRDYAAIDPDTGKPYLPHMAPILLDDDGKPRVASIKEYSDSLAMFLLKAHRPERYRERTEVHLTGKLDVTDRILKARKRTGG